MRRREFILLGGAAVAPLISPLAARAQQADRVRRIGVLMNLASDTQEGQNRVTAFQQNLDTLGWTTGRNLQIDYRWGIADLQRGKFAVAGLLELAPDLILANSVSAIQAAQQATRTVPIVFTAVSEPVELGIVSSLAHPGGNITGFTNLEPSFGGKWLEMLKEIAPRVSRVAFIYNPESTPAAPLFYSSVEAARARFSAETFMVPVHDLADLDSAIKRIGGDATSGLIFPPDTFLSLHQKTIVELAARYRIPAIYPFRYFATIGGLVSYGPDVVDQFRRAAVYVDRILRGEKVGDLPVQQPTKFELVINLKTAKALDLGVAPHLQQLADEVIE